MIIKQIENVAVILKYDTDKHAGAWHLRILYEIIDTVVGNKYCIRENLRKNVQIVHDGKVATVFS